MIIEVGVQLAMMRLIDRKDCTNLHEQHFSHMLASSCEDVLKEFQTLSASNQVAVELPYPSGRGICDIVIDPTSLRFPTNLYGHQIFCECKFYRLGLSNQGPRANLALLWEDFIQVVTEGKGFAYIAVLCENEWDKFVLRTPASEMCFSSNSPSYFSLFQTVAPKKPEDAMQSSGPGVEFKVMRSFTEYFELRFGAAFRPFRIHLFRLYVDKVNSDIFQFESLR